jgi:hypothetical protein
MATARDLITRALKACRILAPGESPSAAEASDALYLLNLMLSSWSNDTLSIYANTLENFTLVSNMSSYTIGTGQTFNTSKPITIQAMYVRSGSIDYPIESMNDIDFANELALKSVAGLPYYYNFNNNYPAAVIKFYPVPDQNYQLFILSEKPLSSLATLDTVVSLPDGWEHAIIYNLAMMLYPEYQQAVDPIIARIAGKSKMAIERAVNRNKTFVFDDGDGYRGTDNIYAGWFR